MSTEALRKELNDFSSIVCLKAIVTGLEQIIGKQAAKGNLIRAGIIRGKTIAKELDISNTDKAIDEWLPLVQQAIGKNGTRLCVVTKIEQDENGVVQVFLSETVCSAGEEPGSARELTFTQGAVQGLAEETLGKRFSSKQVGSVLRGQDYDIVELTPR